MDQVNRGLRAILAIPAIYTAFQSLMGAHQSRVNFVTQRVKPSPGNAVLDIGCGPADILAYLPEVEYQGFDVSKDYITRANARFGQRGTFHCKELTYADLDNMGPFDIVLAIGLFHHLGDEGAVSVMRLAHAALKPGGRLLTIDPCFEKGQNFIARFLVKSDRGQHVRTAEKYKSIAAAVFDSPQVEVRHTRWIPYTHCYMECTR